MLKPTLIAAFLLLCFGAFAQNNTFIKTYGTTLSDVAYDVAVTDNGYIVAGYSSNLTTGKDALLMRLDNTGNPIWTRRYAGVSDEGFTQVTLGNDGGFLAVGYTNSMGQGGNDLMVVKTDNNGNAQWRKTFGGVFDDQSLTQGRILNLPDGYIISGIQYGFTNNGQSGTGIVRLDNAGNTVWSRACNSGGGWNVLSAAYYSGDTLFLGGGSDGDANLVKLNINTGDLMSAIGYSGDQNESLYNIYPTQDGNIVMSDGTWTPSVHTELWFWLNKTDRNGNYIWSKTYRHAGLSLRGAAIPVTDGGYVFAPYDNFDSDGANAALAKVDGSGNLLWSYQYGGNSGHRLLKVKETADGGLIAVGHTASIASGFNNMLIVRTDAHGQVAGCCPKLFSLTADDYYPGIFSRSFDIVPFAGGVNLTLQTGTSAPGISAICSDPQPVITHTVDLFPNEIFAIDGVPYTAPDTVYTTLQGGPCDTLVTWYLKLKIDTITGIVNIYTPVLQFDCDSSLLTVDSTTGFGAGDKVLLIQMQGATVDLSNTNNFGTVLDPGSAGNYEFNRVASVSGNTVQLQFDLTKPYDIAGKVQLIRVPEYTDVTVNNISCKPWDGSTGGVLVMDVKNQLVLNGNMDVSGKGFRGGLVQSGVNISSHETQNYYPPNPKFAAAKGEGIAIIPTDKSYGRGNAANGGGGGNAHNAGGGGGANAGAGGNGGLEYYNVPGSPTSGTDGQGGDGIFALDPERILMGGGGGAGQSNDNHGTSGGNGGGIIILNAKKIQNSGFQLLAKGDDVFGPGGNLANDGQGGGGAGGSIVLVTETLGGQLDCIATGGKGGDCLFYVASQIIGPGGGGGGGKVLYPNSLTGISFDVKFGLNGIANQNLTNGAQQGKPGSKLGDFTITVDTNMVAPAGPIDLNIENPTCAAPNSGAITVLNAPGALYSLNNGAYQNNPVFGGLSAGQYHVSVKSNDCYTKDTLVSLNLQISFYTTSDTFALCPSDTIYINGVGYSQPGVVVDTLPGLNGCDTIATYTIVRGMSPAITQTLSFCPGDSVTINGHVYTQPGTAVSYFIPAQVGCDTLVTWYLEWAPQPTTTKYIDFCPGDHVVIDGVVYSQPDTIQGVIPASAGCDTLATYVLSFATQPSTTKLITFCPGDSVLIDGVHYAQPGTVNGVIPATTGCDTLATYILSFATQPSITKTLLFCPGDFVVIDGVSYTQPGTVNGVIPAATGCDTLATYLLAFAPQPTTIDTIAFCPGDSVTIHGQVYSHPGTVTITLPATSGCDTIATYVLKYALPNTPTHIQINCPFDIYVDADPGDTVQTVTYLTPTANTDCPCPGLSLQLQQGLPSGSLFHLGETNVCYTAKDSCGNAITCCFKVTVTESVACDVKEIGCVKFELLGITADAQQRKTYRVRVTNKCAQKLSYVAIQLPDGIVADLPLTNTMYAAPSGREYLVRNPNYAPIYSVRFSSQNDSIFGGQSDIFKYTLPPQAAPTFINVKVRLEPQVYYETHLNVFDCVVEYAPNNKAANVNRSADLSIYPNPSSGLLYADWTHLSWQPAVLKIYNSQGQLIESRSVQPDVYIEQILLPEKMTEGLYLLEIQSVSGQKETRKFMYIR